MLLGIYLGSTAYSLHVFHKFKKKALEKLTEEGYTFCKNDSTKRDINIHLFVLLILLCPVLNLVYTYAYAKTGFEKEYKFFKEQLIEAGEIVNVIDKNSGKVRANNLYRKNDVIKENNLSPDDVAFLKELHKNKLEREEEKVRSEKYSFSDYPLMEQQIESDASVDRGNAYKKTK